MNTKYRIFYVSIGSKRGNIFFWKDKNMQEMINKAKFKKTIVGMGEEFETQYTEIEVVPLEVANNMKKQCIKGCFCWCCH